jgi:uncharacterized protein (DUF1919 family)
MTVNNIFDLIKRYTGKVNRLLWRNRRDKFRLRNKNMSIISQNCIGGIMYHDLELEFLSPTINLSMNAEDFISFCEQLKVNLSAELEFVETDKPYPVAKLGSGEILLNFLHDIDREKIIRDWERRKKRVNWNNIFIIMTDRDGCTEQIIDRFEKLDYENKILLSHVPNGNYKSIQYIQGYEHRKEVPPLTDIDTFLGRRQYERGFDYIKFLNREMKNKL